MIFLLDMDGVCVDLFSRIEDQMTVGEYILKDPTTFGTWTREDWRRLPETQNHQYLYAILKDYGDVIFCSTVVDGACASGKIAWLQERYGMGFKDFIFAKDKELLAHSDTCLIDDCEANVAAFQREGGHAILYPALSNKMHVLSEQEALLHVIHRVEEIMDHETRIDHSSDG